MRRSSRLRGKKGHDWTGSIVCASRVLGKHVRHTTCTVWISNVSGLSKVCRIEKKTCMDRFGSNATPMGGSGGRVDATIGAIEAQKAEGLLHLHAFMFLQAAHQFNTLHEIAEMLRKSLITVDMLKAYTSNVRRASYPDAAQFQQEKVIIEYAWPEYKNELALCKPPSNISKSFGLCPVGALPLKSEVWKAEGEQWKKSYEKRLQYVMARMNHHIHPVVNQETGERRPFHSCCKKGTPHICKGGFPLDNEMTDVPVLVCACVAELKICAKVALVVSWGQSCQRATTHG